MPKKRILCGIVGATLGVVLAGNGHAAAIDCHDPIVGPKPAVETNKEDPNVQNDYDEMVEEDDRDGVIYLALSNGASPKASDCGLSPSNDQATWTGWGGPISDENVTIGEGVGTRNEIVIGGTYFVRGVGAHAIATLVYDLSGDSYAQFEAWVGMSDEKDPAECGHGGTGDFEFSVDGKSMFKSDMLSGTDGGENVDPVHVLFDIPSGASELEIVMGQADGANSCDHSSIGDAKLLTARALAVDPRSKASITWGALKSRI